MRRLRGVLGAWQGAQARRLGESLNLWRLDFKTETWTRIEETK